MNEASGSDRARRFFRGRKVIVIVVMIVLIVATAGVMWWRQDRDFCDQVADLPDITHSMSASGSPSKGLLEYAAQLEKIASIAPDEPTRSAAQSLAAAQKAVGEALAGNTITASVPSALTALDTPALTAAETQLQQTITSRCHT